MEKNASESMPVKYLKIWNYMRNNNYSSHLHRRCQFPTIFGKIWLNIEIKILIIFKIVVSLFLYYIFYN